MTTSITLILAGLVIITLLWRWHQTRAEVQALQEQLESSRKEHAATLTEVISLRDALLRGIDDVLLVLDSDQHILFANPAAESLLGQELVGETLIGAMRQPELETLIQDAQRLGGEGVERRIEYEQHILQARAVVFQNGSAPRPIEILSLRDVTEIQRLERARREMVSNVIHELSTPITNISLLVETILGIAQEEKLKPKRVRKQLVEIQGATETLTQLMQEMRELALIETGKMPIRLDPSPLVEIVQASVNELQNLANTKEQTINILVPDNLAVLADAMRMQRAFKNILHNAIKFSSTGGQITVSATTSKDEVIIAISDSGPGIPAQDIPRIFERFYQVDRARREGTGLGLAIVRHIVQGHGGRTWVESSEGEGATFYIALGLAHDQAIIKDI